MGKKHSALGIASFIISIVCGVLMFLLVAVASILETTTPGGVDEESAVAAIIGLFAVGFLLLDAIAVGLGIAGLFKQNSDKTFSILGIVFSIITIIATMLLIVIGTIA